MEMTIGLIITYVLMFCWGFLCASEGDFMPWTRLFYFLCGEVVLYLIYLLFKWGSWSVFQWTFIIG